MPPKEDRSLTAFRQAISGQDEEIDLARAALLIARIEYPRLDIEPFMETVNALAAQVLNRTRRKPDPIIQAQALIDVVIKKLGLRGAREDDYYDPRNSFLNDVLERRLGIPISLSILLMGVGSRAGVALGGTSMPMHFLVRILGVEPPLFIDCYGGGQILGEDICEEFVNLISQGTISFERSMLEVISNTDILTRLLTNLKLIYLSESAFSKAVLTLDRLLLIHPDMAFLRRERGLSLYSLKQVAQARRDLEDYLSMAPEAPDASQIQSLLRHIA